MNMERYTRQLSEIGAEGQARLGQSSVLVVGAGGLGSPLLYLLAGAGVGTIAIADGDVVAMSNLNRQFLYTEEDIGESKAQCATKRLQRYNKDIAVVPHAVMITEKNALELVSGYDLVLLAVDNITTRLVVSDACEAQKIPLIDGGIDGFYGTIITAESSKTPYLRTYYQDETTAKKPTGIGAIAAVIASLMANVAMLMLLGRGNPLQGKLLYYDGLTIAIEQLYG